MRIAIDATSILHGERAIRRNSRHLVGELLQRSADIEYVLFYVDRHGLEGLRIAIPVGSRHRERVLRLPGGLVAWSWRRLAWPAVESLVGEVDLVYGTELVFPPARRAVAMSTLHGIAYVSVPDLVTPSHRRGLLRSLRYALRESDYFHVVSQHTKREVMGRLGLPEDRLRVCPNAVDPGFRPLDRAPVKAALRERFGIDGPYVLFVGALSHRKNVLRLIEAFAAVREKLPELSLVLAGPFENAHAPALELVRAKGIAPAVRFLGAIPPERDDLLYLYNGAELLLYPSLHEGWTGPPVEAMACGIPVVASDYSSIPESCGGAAHLVDPLEVDSIARGALEALRDGSLRASLIERGLRWSAQCRWSRSAEILEGIFREVVSLGRRR